MVEAVPDAEQHSWINVRITSHEWGTTSQNLKMEGKYVLWLHGLSPRYKSVNQQYTNKKWIAALSLTSLRWKKRQWHWSLPAVPQWSHHRLQYLPCVVRLESRAISICSRVVGRERRSVVIAYFENIQKTCPRFLFCFISSWSHLLSLLPSLMIWPTFYLVLQLARDSTSWQKFAEWRINTLLN